jgi:hypothetical protein
MTEQCNQMVISNSNNNKYFELAEEIKQMEKLKGVHIWQLQA